MNVAKLLILILLCTTSSLVAQTPDNFKRENLVAWCIVPFDAKERNAVDRVLMLKELGLQRAAYDWREKHVPFFEDEITEYKAAGIEYFSFWGQHASAIELFKKHKLQPQIWQMIPDVGDDSEKKSLDLAVASLMPLVNQTAALGCQLGLYNHGGWGGEPENLAAVCKSLHALGHNHVGIVYNMHHGHGHIADFPASLELMKPYLICLNLNGMVDLNSPKYKNKTGTHKILPIGAGDHERSMIETIISSQYSGPIGVLGHVAERDVAEVLSENLQGLEWILEGGTEPSWLKERSHSAPEEALVEISKGNQALDVRIGFLNVEAGQRFNKGNLRIDCRARIFDKQNFNILAAKNPKSSFSHWEFYAYASSGNLSFYLPGAVPSEIQTTVNVADGKWHGMGVEYQLDHNNKNGTVKLFVDNELVHTQEVALRENGPITDGPLTIGGLASRQFGCNGQIDFVKISNHSGQKPADGSVIGSWTFDHANKPEQIQDVSKNRLATRFVPTNLDSDYLSKWTPKHRRDSRFPYENETDKDWVDDRFSKMDTGPFFCQSIRIPGRGVIPKAIAIRAQEANGTHLLYNSETLNLEAAWSGEFIALPPARFGILQTPSIAGTIELLGPKNVAWVTGDSTKTTSTKLASLTLQGSKIGFHCEIDGESIIEYPSSQTVEDVRVVTRRFPNQPRSRDLTVPLFELPENESEIEKEAIFPYKNAGQGIEKIHVFRNDKTAAVVRTNAEVEVRNGHIWFTIAGEQESIAGSIAVRYAKMPIEKLPKFLSEFKSLDDVVLAANEVPGAHSFHEKRWGNPLTTQGVRSSSTKPFAVDTITVPYENRFNALMFTSGFDFLPDGRAVVCTVHGDVWLVSGIDDELKEIKWQRFATGLYQPLGLKVVEKAGKSGKPAIFVLCRDRIIELRDVNSDGEADIYSTFCDELEITGENHGYAMSLETDPEGNFYFIKSGSTPPHGGTMLKVDKTGKLSVFATGYRHANGLGVSPLGLITSADNEGNWIPATRLDAVREGGFYGHMPTHRRPETPTTYDPPMMWMPRTMDNSAGGQVWVSANNWGALNGAMIHLSFGRCSANVVLPQETQDGTYQAAAYKMDLPLFLSGSMRGRFRSNDHHMYVCGLDGWQTAAVKDGCFQRVRATGARYCLPIDFEVSNGKVEITLSEPVDPGSVNDLKNWKIEEWGYRWTKDYGSEHYSVSNPEVVGHDTVALESVKLNSDHTKITLEIPSLHPVMQMNIRCNLKSAAGAPVNINLYNTINKLR